MLKTYTNILSIRRQNKNDRAYRICKFVHGSYHWWKYFKLGGSSKNDHAYRICKFVYGIVDINVLDIKKIVMQTGFLICAMHVHQSFVNLKNIV